MLKRRLHPCKECLTWCLMRLIACSIWALVSWGHQNFNDCGKTAFYLYNVWNQWSFLYLEYQVRSIASHVRPDRQSKWFSSAVFCYLFRCWDNTSLFCFSSSNTSFTALLFSATFRRKIERLARDILIDPIRVVQGDIGEVMWDVLFCF